jgi:geranylgeranyl pyrophosphate synthase
MEIGRIAAGCLDEWQDQDTEDALWQAIGPKRTVSLAVGMIGLSFLALDRLVDEGMEPALAVDLRDEFGYTLLQMSAGQHMDLSGAVTLDNYEAVVGAKSGALFRLGCRAGALVAGASADVVRRYGEFGHNLGIIVQVWNDVFGLAGIHGKKDTERGRTLPILAAEAMQQGLGGAGYHPHSAEGEAGQLYTVLQLGILYERASEALARCPAPGKLSRFLEEYDPGRLAEMMEQPRPLHEEDDGHQAV